MREDRVFNVINSRKLHKKEDAIKSNSEAPWREKRIGLVVGAGAEEWPGGAEKCCLSVVQRSEFIFQRQNGLSGVGPET